MSSLQPTLIDGIRWQARGDPLMGSCGFMVRPFVCDPLGQPGRALLALWHRGLPLHPPAPYRGWAGSQCSWTKTCQSGQERALQDKLTTMVGITVTHCLGRFSWGPPSLWGEIVNPEGWGRRRRVGLSVAQTTNQGKHSPYTPGVLGGSPCPGHQVPLHPAPCPAFPAVTLGKALKGL